MWGKKKPDTRQAADPGPTNLQTNQPPKPATAAWEGTTKMNKDVMRPAGETADRAPSRLGSSLHVKGEISGNEDLDIDGTIEGLVYIDERRLTVGGPLARILPFASHPCARFDGHECHLLLDLIQFALPAGVIARLPPNGARLEVLALCNTLPCCFVLWCSVYRTRG
jgi:hypothetical protein